MPKKGITGHDEWVLTEALATALVALEQLPPVSQPRPHMEDIRKLLIAGCQHGTVINNVFFVFCLSYSFQNDRRRFRPSRCALHPAVILISARR